MQSAVSIVTAISVFAIVVLPALSWFALENRRSMKVMLWFGGLAGIALASLAVAVLQKASWINGSFLFLGYLLAWLSLRAESRPLPWRWPPILALGVVHTLLQLGWDLMGRRQDLGILFSNTILILLQGLLLLEAGRLVQKNAGKGLVLVALGVVFVAGVNLYRSVLIVMEGPQPPLMSFTSSANMAILAIVVCSVLMNLGYLLFVLEKTHQRELDEVQRSARMQTEQDLSRLHAEELRQLVVQREETLLASSRFSTMNTLTMFHSAIVHELSQPIQSLMSIVDKIEMRVAHAEEGLRKDVANALQVLRQLSGSLGSLRKLIAAKSLDIDSIFLLPVIEEVFSILETEAGRRGILFEFQIEPSQDTVMVRADKIMLLRILLNLATNAFEALERHPSPPGGRMIRLLVGCKEVNGVRMSSLRMEDNGPGFSPHLLARLGYQYASTKADGVGMGLVLTRVMVESWSGHLRIHNRDPGQGAVAELLLARA